MRRSTLKAFAATVVLSTLIAVTAGCGGGYGGGGGGGYSPPSPMPTSTMRP